jgi:catechol 2,3-dioxygenase-like lactoylglutathione lyase family enzyme
MLATGEAYAVLAAEDIQRARTYYKDKLGLDPAEDGEGELRYRMQGGTGFLIYETGNARSAKNTVLCWITDDLDGEMSELRGRGVVFEDYDFPGLKTENGVSTTGSERAAWFTDSEGNILCLAQRT